MVYLVGAGPGDEKLITVRGAELIRKAEVIIYDRLAAESLLLKASPDCELIYAGKESGEHTLRQQEINALLVKKGRSAGVVVRLKGGDPFIFGRGGEEALALAEAGVDFEICPGVSSFYACPAYAGVPVTHRGIARSVHVITGTQEGEPPSPKDIRKLAELEGTLVFLMGVANMPAIVSALLEGGKSPATPAALIQSGCTARQKTVTAPLCEIVETGSGICAPAILLVGEVAALRENLSWIEKRPLFGKRVLLMRAPGQAQDISSKLYDLGAEPVLTPSIYIEPPDFACLDKELARLGEYDWIFFSSSNGVDAFFGRMAQKKIDIRRLGLLKTLAVGTHTAARLERHGIFADYVPAERARLGEVIKGGERILIPTSDIGGHGFVKETRRLGAKPTLVTAYNTRTAHAAAEEFAENVDAIVFMSPSQAAGFVNMGGKAGRARLYSIGVTTTNAIIKLGLGTPHTACDADMDSLISLILKTL